MMENDLFKLHDTYGFPILFIAEILDEYDLSFNWLEWMKEAINANWTYDRIKKTIHLVNNQIYGESWKEHEKMIPVIYLLLTETKDE